MLIIDAMEEYTAALEKSARLRDIRDQCEHVLHTQGTAPGRTLWNIFNPIPDPHWRAARVHEIIFGPVCMLRPDSGQIEGVPTGWNFGTPEKPDIRYHYEQWPKEWKDYWTKRPKTPQAEFLYSEHKTVAFVGGNGVAKTTSLVAAMLAHTLGIRPWLTPDDPLSKVRLPNGSLVKTPVTLIYLTDDFKKIQDNLFDQKLFRKGGWPDTHYEPKRDAIKINQLLLAFDKTHKGSPVDQACKRNTQGYPAKLSWANHSLWVFASYAQAREAVEGPEYDGVYFDEPPTNWAYEGAFRGTRESGGPLRLALSPLSEPWIQSGIIDAARASNDIHVIQSDGFANYRNQDPAWIYQFIDKLAYSPNKISARIFGQYGVTAGSEFEEWSTRPEAGYSIEYKPYPATWPVVMGIDPHPEKDPRVAWLLVTPGNAVVVLATCLLKGLGTIEMVQEIEQKEVQFPWNNPVVLRIMDPHIAVMHNSRQTSDTASVLEAWEAKSPKWLWEIPEARGPGSINIGHGMMHDLMRPAFNRLSGKEEPRFQVVRDFDEARLGEALIKYGWRAKETEGKDDVAVEKTLRDDWTKDIVDAVRYPIVYGLVYEELIAMLGSTRPSERSIVVTKAGV